MKRIYILILAVTSINALAQVGVNSQVPKASLDITSKPEDPNFIDGIIPPKLTGDQLKAKNSLYGAEQIGTFVYATQAITGDDTTGKTSEITEEGYYYFDGTKWVRFNSQIIDEESGSEVKKIQFFGNSGEDKTVINGIFQFRLIGNNNADLTYQIRPIKAPVAPINIAVSTIARWGGVGGSPTAFNTTISFDSTNWNTWKNIGVVTGSLNGHNSILSVDMGDSTAIFYNLLVQRVDSKLKSLIINRY